MANRVDSKEGSRARAFVESHQQEYGYKVNPITYRPDGSIKTTSTSLSYGHGKKFIEIYGRDEALHIYIRNGSVCPEFTAIKDLIVSRGYIIKDSVQGQLKYCFEIPLSDTEEVLGRMLEARNSFGMSDL